MAGLPVHILTPVHNGERHLAECIESVLAQTFSDWEYLIVDNCSTDATREIAERYAAADGRISYERHDEYVDVIASHNRAFDALDPRSVYCKVVSGDDWLYPECLERMVAVADSNPHVGLVSAYRLAGTFIDLVGLPYSRSVVPGAEILRQSLLGGPYVTGTPTSVLIRSELIRVRRPFYDPTFRHADTEAAYWTFTQSDFALIHQVLTYTRIEPNGETPISQQLSSYQPENLRMLIRYGSATLPEAEYHRQLRLELRRYVKWHLKQALKPSRRRDEKFRAYHRRAAGLIAAEANGDGAVHRAMRVVRTLVR
jgi:glycosyltransferase involved in cell wall biosynthesis